MDFLRLFQHLLPRGRAWRITVEKRLRQFFAGLTIIPEGVKSNVDSVFLDLFPGTTTRLDDWEAQFGMQPTSSTDAERRERLAAAWRQLYGGQSPKFIQDTLQAAGFDVYVHQWWEDVPGRPNGGSIDGNATPVARDPLEYLWSGAYPRTYYAGCGNVLTECGGASAFANSQLDPPGYALVNKVKTVSILPVGCGNDLMYCGGTAAASGSESLTFPFKTYQIPDDPDVFPYFLYIGGGEFPKMASVEGARREEFERLCLRVCPAQQWLGILVSYS